MSAALELHTTRLTLRTLDAAHAPQVTDYLRRNRMFFTPWSPTFEDAYFTVAAQRERLQHEAERRARGDQVRFWLFARADAQHAQIIGDLAFSNIIRGAFQSCHLGYQLDAAACGQGLMAEALRAALAFAFEELRLHRIEANIIPRNERSRRLVAWLGFVEEGLARTYLKINGVWEDHLHYVLFNPDSAL